LTTRDLLTRALRTIGFVGEDQPLTDPVANDALLILQDLIDAWNSDRRAIFTNDRDVFPLTANTKTYTIGPTGVFVHNRPEWIDNAALIRLSDPLAFEYPVEVFEDREWQDIRIKDLASTLVTGLYYNPVFPNGEIDVYPVPTVGGLQLVLYTPTLLSEPIDLDTLISMPPGYRRAFRTNLAVELHPEFGRGRPLNAVLAKQAADSLKAIHDVNLDPGILIPDPGMNVSGGNDNVGYNVYTNSYRPR
jgi:hypothetical protein